MIINDHRVFPTRPRAYYNENDPYAAQWLRNLISAGHIADGVVDERSIEDVRPDDLRDFVQCHFFAGIGVWSLALRRAGWPDDRPVWTGSCPCQPFSAAGKGAGFADERHLWPAFYHLIAEHKKWCDAQKRRFPTLYGEQVASSDVDVWIDLVHADLEGLGLTFGSIPFPSAGIGAPHIRDRNYWVAHANNSRLEGRGVSAKRATQLASGARGLDGWLANATDQRQHRRRSGEASNGRHTPRVEPERLCDVGDRPSPTNGFWRDADWIGCTDGKWRPVEPGTSPLAAGATARMGRLRAYGNAINAEAARCFIECVMELT